MSEMIDTLATTDNCLSFLQEGMQAVFSIIEYLWCDKETKEKMDISRNLLNDAFNADCKGACKECRKFLSKIFQELQWVGVDEIFFDLIQIKRNALLSHRENRET